MADGCGSKSASAASNAPAAGSLHERMVKRMINLNAPRERALLFQIGRHRLSETRGPESVMERGPLNAEIVTVRSSAAR